MTPGKISRQYVTIISLSLLIFGTQPAPSEGVEDYPAGKRYALACLLDELCTRRMFFDVSGLSSDAQAKIVKWTKPIELRFEPGDHVARSEVISAIREVYEAALASGLPDRSDETNADFALPLWIVFGDDPESQTENQTDLRSSLLARTAKDLAAAPDRPCQGHLQFSTKAFEPVGAALRLREGVEGHAITTCANQILFRLMGLYGTSGARGFDSLLTDGQRRIIGDNQPHFSGFDRVMLDLLYDSTIDAGMDAKAVNDVFHDIYERIFPSRGERDEQLMSDLVDPIDRATYECMIDKVCVLDNFIVMTISGSDFEPNPTEHQAISKLILPAALRLMIDPSVSEEVRRAAERGYNYVMAMASAMSLPHMPVHPNDSIADTNGLLFVSADPSGARANVFADWLQQPRLGNLYNLALSGLERHDCTAVTEFNLTGYGTTFMMSLVPVYGDRTPEFVRRCVIEESLQAFGLNFDINSGVQTMFDDRPDNIRLTGFDVLMFSLLYHPLIEPDMTESDVRGVFDQVYEEVWGKFSADTWWREGLAISD